MISRRRLRRFLAAALAFVAILGVALWTAPRCLVPRIAAAWPGCLYSVHTNEKAVAFTFDDGPDSGHTDEILEMLKANDAHATFFFASSHVGNHLTRVEPSIRLSPAAFDAAVREAGAYLSRFGPVRWLRPGSTWYNTRMLGPIQRSESSQSGLLSHMGSRNVRSTLSRRSVVHRPEPIGRDAGVCRAFVSDVHQREGRQIPTTRRQTGAVRPRTARCTGTPEVLPHRRGPSRGAKVTTHRQGAHRMS